MTHRIPAITALFVLNVIHPVHAGSFYKEKPLFSTAPTEEKSMISIDRFGPVGMAVELHQPAFIMKVGKIEEGSPAAAAGELKKGQIIEAINGEKLRGIDPRIQLGEIIGQAEATDGLVKFMVKDTAEAAGQEVVVKIPVLGAYSETWPLDCPKSDRIVRDLADHLATPESHKGFADFGMLFLLSTGEEKDLAPVKAWVHGLAGKKSSGYAWHIGYGGLAICEYYLRTGDQVALPIIQKWVDAAAAGEYLDGWAGRGGVTRLNYGGGHLNAAGTGVVTFLLLAKQCGSDVDDSLLHRTLVHFFRYAGRGLNPYGDDRPETSFVDNGKNGILAFTMAAAASLTPEGEKSIYARARDVAAMSSFYTTTFMLHGHTGGGIGEIWRSAAMGLMHQTRPKQYREFMDHRKWHYDMSRRFDGSFGILGGARYDHVEWGNCYPITYTIPRKTLRITGAPPSEFSKSYQLPARPWGTEADDAFVSMEPAAGKDGKRQDLSMETLSEDSALPLIRRINSLEEVSDDEIRRYAYHPDYIVRHAVGLRAAGFSVDYMFPKPGHRFRPELITEFCESSDPRVRDIGFRAAARGFDPAAEWAGPLFALAVARLEDPAESWWVKDAAFKLIAAGTADMIVPHVDLLIPYLEHPEQWLQNGALTALAVVVVDERCYEKVLPAVGELIQKSQRISTKGGPIHAMRQQLPEASPAARELAIQAIGGAYENFEGVKTWPGGLDLAGNYEEHVEIIANLLSDIPGGYDALYKISQRRYPNDPLPHDDLFLSVDPEKFGEELQGAIKPIIRDELIYKYSGENRGKIFSDLQFGRQSGSVTNSLDPLVDLYNKVGVHEYDWKPFGPDLKNAEWNYFSFDPPEKQKYDKSPWRYRPVTCPSGMENWFAPDFDPAKAGWKKGQAPFGQFKGELTTNETPQTRPDTIWATTPRSLWENEVLLVSGSFEFPMPKPGHIYRLRVQTGQGVGSGDGFKVYLNGKELVETKEGLGRRAGDTIRGGWITPEFAEQFGDGPLTVAATSFLRYGDRAIVQMPPVPQGTFSMWLEERKLPPLDIETFRKAATFIPMLSSEWQALQDPQNMEPPTDEGKFRYDGKFTTNPKVTGSWKTIDLVDNIPDFTPDKKMSVDRSPIKNVTLKDTGLTDSESFIWSGDMLMNLDRYEVLRMTPKTIAGIEYLFIEAGDFNLKKPAGWRTQFMVMEKN